MTTLSNDKEKTSLPLIGVIGGMGPAATALFFERLIRATPAQGDEDHIPLLIHNNPQIPSRIAALIDGGKDDPLPVLIAMAKGLEAQGVQSLVMPCNTAHIFADEIQANIHIPLLNMIEETAHHLLAHAVTAQAKRIGILASPAPRLSRLFKEKFNAIGLQPYFLDQESEILNIIMEVKKKGASHATQKALIEQAKRLKKAHNIGQLLIGCSELSLLNKGLETIAPTSDSLDILIKATLNFCQIITYT